jgi:transcriptional regulator with XRE-family HTH domain
MSGEEGEVGTANGRGSDVADAASTGETAGERAGQADGGSQELEVQCVIRVGGVPFIMVPAETRDGGLPVPAETRDGGLSVRTETRDGWPGRESRKPERNTVAAQLWDARWRARLTQAELARRLGKSQALVSQAERGLTRVGPRYVRQVFAACDVVMDEKLEIEIAQREATEVLPRDWANNPLWCAGLDPATLEPVRRGSARDMELRQSSKMWRIWSGADDEEELSRARAASLEEAGSDAEAPSGRGHGY